MKWCENETPIYKSSISKSDVIKTDATAITTACIWDRTIAIICSEITTPTEIDIRTILKNEKWSQKKPHIDKPIRKEWVQRFHKSELGKMIQKGMSPVNWAIQVQKYTQNQTERLSPMN